MRQFLKTLYLILLAWIRGQDWRMKNEAKKGVADAVENTADKHRDAMRSADGSGVRPDDPGLFRD